MADSSTKKTIRERFIAFLKRRFPSSRTLEQTRIDILFGIVLPALCLIFDPIVFRNSILGTPMVQNDFQLPAYFAMITGMVALGLWIVIELRNGEQNPKHGAVLSGILVFGALFSAITALMLLPISLLGILLAGIGIFGLIPFVTAVVYLRNGIRVTRRTLQQADKTLLTYFLAGMLLVSVVPVVAGWQATRVRTEAIDQILHGDPLAAESAARTLKAMFWCSRGCYWDLIRAYDWEKDAARKELISNFYKQITGESIIAASESLMD